jgi:hypothetical protein
MSMLKKILKGLYRYAYLILHTSPYGRMSFGQEGEDIVLLKIFQFLKTGFYVDIGAHHPSKYSNTKAFYTKGWSGINIDPIPGMKKRFDKARPRDINLQMGVGTQAQKMPFFVFSEGAYNTCSPEKAKIVEGLGVTLLAKEEILITPLSEILDKYLPENQEIDFFSIDAETMDFDVLKSNDWEKYGPKIVLVEMLTTNIEDCHKDEVYLFLKDKGYDLISKTVNTAFYKRQDFNEKVSPTA